MTILFEVCNVGSQKIQHGVEMGMETELSETDTKLLATMIDTTRNKSEILVVFC